MPLITHLFPGSGINPGTVHGYDVLWWLKYAGQAKAYAAAADDRARKERTRRRG